MTLWRAADTDDAIRLAEAEAGEYVQVIGWVYLGLAQCYRVADEIGAGAEHQMPVVDV